MSEKGQNDQFCEISNILTVDLKHLIQLLTSKMTIICPVWIKIMNSQGPNRFLDEFAKLMTDAAGLAQGVQKEAETVFRAQGERVMAKMDLVQREDFDVVRDMAARAREENQALKEQLLALEARISVLEKPAKSPKPRAKTKK